MCSFVVAIMACWFYIGEVLTSLAYLSEITGSDIPDIR